MKKMKFCGVFALLIALLVGVLAVPVSAGEPVFLAPNFASGGVNYAGSTNGEVPNYGVEGTTKIVSSALAFAYMECFTRDYFINSAFLQVNSANNPRVYDMKNMRAHYLMTTTSRYTETSTYMSVYVYFAYTAQSVGTYVKVDGIPEEWGARGAHLSVASDSMIVGLAIYRLVYDVNKNVYFVRQLGLSSFDFSNLANTQAINLGTQEQIVHARAFIGDGWADSYNEGTAVGYLSGADNWINAYKVFNGESVGGGFTQEDVDNAYDDGYMDGEQSGYHQGAQDGYANGYANGYDEGYSFSAGAEEVESAYADGKADGVTEGYANGYANGYDKGYDNGVETGYADGKADGITEGYQTGKADGVAEGYANGYDVGYDNGLETGYADGKADGITEGYQTGKADGVAEGYANGYDVGYDNGLETGYADGKADGITEGYQTGKADGVAEGYANGYTAGYDTGYDTGYDEGYDYGYNLGEGVGSTKIDIGEIISAVPEGAKSIINGALGFEIFGINVAGTLTALLVVAIVAYVVRKLMSR